MKKETKSLLIKYVVCFVVASIITVAIFAIRGFFGDNAGVNFQVLSDGFTISGLLLLLAAGMLYISDEGALLGISYVIRNMLLTFIPMGRAKHELYRDYRERKLKEKKRSLNINGVLLVIGGIFFVIGLVFTFIWYNNFYNTVPQPGV